MRKAALILLIFFNACLMIGFLAGTALGGTASAREGSPAPRSAAVEDLALAPERVGQESEVQVPEAEAPAGQAPDPAAPAGLSMEVQASAKAEPAASPQASEQAVDQAVEQAPQQAPEQAPQPAAGQAAPAVQPLAFTATESPTGQRTILFVGVDDLNAPTPVVKSIWMLFYIPSSPGLTLAPVYPAMTNEQAEADGALAAAFGMNADGSPSTRFATALIERDIRWNQYAILDHAGLAALVDTLGGVDLGSSRLGGQDVLAYLAAVQADIPANLESQAALIKSLCVIPSRPEVHIDIPALFTLLNGRVRTSLSPEWVATDWQSLGMAGGQLCKFPTLRSSY